MTMKTRRKPHNPAPPPCKVMCKTCPFRDGSPYESLRAHLMESSLKEGSRECHSTGTKGFKGNTKKPARTCRGSRDFQLQVMYRLGVLSAPTDEAWEERRKEIGC